MWRTGTDPGCLYEHGRVTSFGVSVVGTEEKAGIKETFREKIGEVINIATRFGGELRTVSIQAWISAKLKQVSVIQIAVPDDS